ncbi:hypothetical protein PR202_gb21820 [Eleusine coracana subsp. coracana]|uniref:Peroxidase n=1 Tax=Eleusine coracana subsp. coracana TaxID=191504 RepID=A0AAV5FE46_ELECO|nr:hypothetical protein QOZ80_7BG0610290 [Eleusine coracana subsp. coracana]GJN33242.1 hypothetical protein PR202_gb21820 [Eleusine coracana subsp. coracana]
MPSNSMKSSTPPSSNAPAYPPPGSSPSSSVAPPVYPIESSPSPSPSSSVPSPTDANSPSPSLAPPSGLRVGYYGYSCPNAESIVRAAVKSAVDANPGTGAGLIRLFFHDCFVQGCDASVLLNTTTTGQSPTTERQSPPNLTLRGFEAIDAAKAALEAACPRTVSCADAVAFAARDATFFLSAGRVDFGVPAGRLDGRVSRADEALANLPPPTAGVQALTDMFAAKGLDADDMVTLSGAHTVGRAHCSSFSGRIPPNNVSSSSDAMNPTLAASLGQQCNSSSNGGGDPAVAQDLVTPNKLDSQYYWNVINHDVLFASDAALLTSNRTAAMVSDNAFTPGLWEAKFKRAMVKMGLVGVKTTSAEGEIRERCWMTNN